MLSPNNDALYDNTRLDLADGPLVIERPHRDERYRTPGFLDFWTKPFANAGRRTAGNFARRQFVHGPRRQGAVPGGLVRIAAPGAGSAPHLNGDLLMKQAGTFAEAGLPHIVGCGCLGFIMPNGTPDDFAGFIVR